MCQVRMQGWVWAGVVQFKALIEASARTCMAHKHECRSGGNSYCRAPTGSTLGTWK
jgi:hypothetical protein